MRGSRFVRLSENKSHGLIRRIEDMVFACFSMAEKRGLDCARRDDMDRNGGGGLN